MQPIHKELEYKSLYTTEKMTYVTVCLDSGKIATEACKNDIRGERTQQVLVYPEDRPSGSCTQHIEMDCCTTGDGVATEWCKHFAGVDATVKLAKKSLLKLTEDQFNEIKKAMNHGLEAEYSNDNYVYLTKNDGKDANFKGFRGEIKNKVSTPYKACTVHTEEKWEEYLRNNPFGSPGTQPETPSDTTPSTNEN